MGKHGNGHPGLTMDSIIYSHTSCKGREEKRIMLDSNTENLYITQISRITTP